MFVSNTFSHLYTVNKPHLYCRPTTVETTAPPAPSSGALHRKDLDGMIRYALYQEISTHPSIRGAALVALREYIKVLARVSTTRVFFCLVFLVRGRS